MYTKLSVHTTPDGLHPITRKPLIQDVVVEDHPSLIVTCPQCGHDGWCYPQQALGTVSIVCKGEGCRWHETQNWWNLFWSQELILAQRNIALKEAQYVQP